MRNFLKDMAVLSYATAIGGVAITIAAMFVYNDLQAAMIATIVYITAPIIGATLQTIARA